MEQEADSLTGYHKYKGTVLQFGMAIDEKHLLNAALGAQMKSSVGSATFGYIPTILIKGEQQQMEIAGQWL